MMYTFSSEDRLYENWTLIDDNNKPFLDKTTFVLANGSGLTSSDTITIFQL